MSISISKEVNPNYLAKVVELKNLQKHPNADRLQVVRRARMLGLKVFNVEYNNF